jgi:hypothetical protein
MKKHTIAAIVEWVLVVLLFWLFIQEDIYPIGSRTPEKAHRLSERGFHYGPSNIVRKVNVPFDKHQVVFLGTYKDWFSADSVLQKRGGWVPGDGVGGVKIDRSKPFSYSWSGNSTHDSLMMYKFYGYVTDDRIATVELLMTDKETDNLTSMREEMANDHMFLFIREEKNGNLKWQAVRGLDKAGNILYEQKLS